MSRRAVIIWLFLSIVGLLAWQGLPLREPRHAGQPLSHWLGLLAHNQPDTRTQALQAVNHIGADAIPHLMRMVNAKDSRLKVKAMDWADRWSPFAIKFTVASTSHARAALGSAALDEAVASPAIPRLVESLNEGETALGAAEALSAIGPSGLFSLTNCIRHADNRVRLAVVTTIARSVVGGCPKLHSVEQRERAAEIFVPICLEFVNDKDSDIRAQAAQALGWYRRKPVVVVPALAALLADNEYFPRSVACQALADFGEPAKTALPALQRYAAQAKGATEREMALQAIAKIETNPASLNTQAGGQHP